MNRYMMGVAGVAVAAGLLAGGCASSGSGAEKSSSGKTATAVKTPSAAEQMFNQVKGLEGTWEMADDKGAKQVAVVYRVVAAGSVVCEQMFPGSQHEMVNMYHLDGNRLLVTHYCASGNQPRMQAMSQPKHGEIAFTSESVTNLAEPGGEYMGGLVLEMPDTDHLTQKWTSQKAGVETEHATFAMTRRKS